MQLATRNLDSSRYSGVIALFQEHFVRTGLVPTDTARADQPPCGGRTSTTICAFSDDARLSRRPDDCDESTSPRTGSFRAVAEAETPNLKSEPISFIRKQPPRPLPT